MSAGKQYKHANPDRGPRMIEGAHKFDKGYESDEETFAPRMAFPDDHERGNDYFEMRNKALREDSKKLERSKFSKMH